MTNNLNKAFDAASQLPPEEKDALAAAILEEVAVDPEGRYATPWALAHARR